MKIKYLAVLILVFIMLLSFCACKKKETLKTKDSSASVASSQNKTEADENAEVEAENHDFSFLFGTWRLVSGQGLNTYVFDDKGGWVSYTDEGEIYHQGKLKACLEYENLYRYDLYADDGSLCYSFYMDNDTTFHIGNEGENVYQKITR